MITHRLQTGRLHSIYEAGRDNSVDNGIFIHAVVPWHVETVCLLYRQKDKFISVPHEPKDAEYPKKS